VNVLLSVVNRFLPENGEHGHQSKKGYDSESPLSMGSVGSVSDSAAIKNNEF
jgi:hypothetical protein